MEDIFKSTKKPSGKAKQSSLLAKDLFKRIEPANPLANVPEEMKQHEAIIIHGVAGEGNQHHQGYHPHHGSSRDHNRDDVPAMADDHISRPQISFEITNCFQLALKQESRLGTGCNLLNEFLR